jgi:hypothetical protein
MIRIPKLGEIAVAASALTIAAVWAPPASAQIVGLPTGGSYGPYDSFAQDWYDPGDWYGRAGGSGGIEVGGGYGAYPADARGGIGRGLGEGYGYGTGGFRPRARVSNRAASFGGNFDGGLYEGPGTLGEGGEEDYAAPPSRPTPYRGSPYFMRGYSPYYGYRDFDDDFYEDEFYGGYGGEASDELDRDAAGLGLGQTEAPTDLDAPLTGTATAGRPPAPAIDGGVSRAAGPGATAIDAPRQIEESDELYEDYDSLYGGYGDYQYVEEGSDRYQPMRGLGPRYRNFYSEDWFDDGADFDDWYDSTMEPLGEEFAQPESREGISEINDRAPDGESLRVRP